MREKVLAIINEIRATKELPAVSSLNVNDNLRNNLDLTSFNLAELTVRIEDEFDIDIFRGWSCEHYWRSSCKVGKIKTV